MIIYDPLFQTMERKGISSYKLGKMGFPMSNYHAIRRGCTSQRKRLMPFVIFWTVMYPMSSNFGEKA